MILIKPYARIMDIGSAPRYDDLRKILNSYGICYQAEKGWISEWTPRLKWLREKIAAGHESPLEHVSISVDIVCDRAIANELVRHRIASFTQESTRYCNYTKEKFGSELTFIEPPWCDGVMRQAFTDAEDHYFHLIENGMKPEEARAVLPLALKTELMMSANLREWRHVFKLRAADMTGKAHPQMKEIMLPLLSDFTKLYPGVFDDIYEHIVPKEKGE